jgi:LmbE family N-acetylglucosaminyl deacetylase
MSSRRGRRHSGGSTSRRGQRAAAERPTDRAPRRFLSFSGRSKFLWLALSAAVVAVALISYGLVAVYGAPADWYDANAKNLLIVVASHTDDFDIAVGGQALMYQAKGAEVVVVMVSDVTADSDSYNYGVSHGLFSADMEHTKPEVAPNGEAFGRSVYSRNCGQYRINDMRDRYKTFGFVSVLPKTPFPDGGGFLPQTIQDSYLVALKADLKTQLADAIRKSGATNVAIYCHDPANLTGVDHAWAGRLGVALYGTMKTELSQIKFHQYLFYVYTGGGDPRSGFAAIDVSREYADKSRLYADIFEYSGTDLKHFLTTLNRIPEPGHDFWFKHEVRKAVAG